MAVDISSISIPPLPTLDNLNATVPDDVDAHSIASEWLAALAAALESDSNLAAINSLFVEDSWWRDMLSLTWDFRTFRGISSIITFLKDRIRFTHPKSFSLRQDLLGLQRPYHDIAWINALFDFETDVGIGFGVFRLVPTANGEWKAHTVYTNLEGLKGFPEKVGALRNQECNHSLWEKDRMREREFENGDPSVLIIGGGHSGLEVAARLKAYDIPSLVVERNERIGDNWRNRYDSLALHDPVYFHHMPYLPFPSTWPKYPHARKVANWLEGYVEALDLNVWTSSEVTAATYDPSSGKWEVTVNRADGVNHVLNVNHVVFTTGFSGVTPKIPGIPGIEIFKGETMHSSQYQNASSHVGKKVVVIGACTSAHDIAHDCYTHEIDITMYQRSSTFIMTTKSANEVMFKGFYDENGPPIDIADRLSASRPNFMGLGLMQRVTKRILELDRELLDALHKRGFRTNEGIHGTGLLPLLWRSLGGFYLDVGASQLIADGKIKLKNDSQIKEFTGNGLSFEDGSELLADVVVFATGLSDSTENIRAVCGDGVADRCPPLWSLNKEGEISGNARDLGTPGLWYLAGKFARSRFHSKHVALQIKAKEEGLFCERYSLV